MAHLYDLQHRFRSQHSAKHIERLSRVAELFRQTITKEGDSRYDLAIAGTFKLEVEEDRFHVRIGPRRIVGIWDLARDGMDWLGRYRFELLSHDVSGVPTSTPILTIEFNQAAECRFGSSGDWQFVLDDRPFREPIFSFVCDHILCAFEDEMARSRDRERQIPAE